MRRRRLRLVLAAFLVVCLAGGAWVLAAQRFPAHEERISGTAITLRVQSGVSQRETRLVRDGLVLADRYLDRRLGGGTREPVEVRVAREDPCEPFAPREATGFAKRGFLCVDTRSPGWPELLREDEHSALALSAHEHVHNLQYELGCAPDPGEHTYRWLMEGMAMHLSWSALVTAGRATDLDAARSVRDVGGLRDALGPLARHERDRPAADGEYGLWHLAVRRLARFAGPLALRAFCRRAGAGEPWTEAFRAAFGLPVPRFYAAFERERRRIADGAPIPRVAEP